MTLTFDLNNQTRSLTDMMALVHGAAPLPGFGAQPSTTAAQVSGYAAGPANNGKKPRAKKSSTNSLPKNKGAMKHITTVDGKDGNVSYRVQIRRQKDGNRAGLEEDRLEPQLYDEDGDDEDAVDIEPTPMQIEDAALAELIAQASALAARPVTPRNSSRKRSISSKPSSRVPRQVRNP